MFEAPFERPKLEDCHLHPSKYKEEIGEELYPRLVDASLALVVEEKMLYVCLGRLRRIIDSKHFQDICTIHSLRITGSCKKIPKLRKAFRISFSNGLSERHNVLASFW